MEDWTANEVTERIEQDELTILYVYTPLCGTCQLANKMLTVVEAALPALRIGKINLNYSPDLAIKYEIESVPSLLIFQKGQLQKRVYAFQSVEYLYYELKTLID